MGHMNALELLKTYSFVAEKLWKRFARLRCFQYSLRRFKNGSNYTFTVGYCLKVLLS